MTSRRRQGVRPDQWGVPDQDEDGRAVCRWCRTLVRPPRRTFCSEACVHEWRVRTDPTYVRAQIFKRDDGACQLCGLDLRAARRAWRLERPRWEADHIVPVADGGGECGLENYRLLCRACHVSVTAAWRRARVDRGNDPRAARVA